MKTKRFFISVIAFVFTMGAWAQNEVQYALLQHGDNITSFKGSTALSEAVAAADDGDVITVSQGIFTGDIYIKKSISIYGAGFEEDAVAGTEKTETTGQIFIGADDTNTTISQVHFEGMCITGNYYTRLYVGNNSPVSNLSISKCNVSSYIWVSRDVDQITIDNSVINSLCGSDKTRTVGNLLIKNTYITNVVIDLSLESSVLIDHCIQAGNYGPKDNTAQFRYTNCIFVASGSSNSSNNQPYHNSLGSTLDHCIYNTTNTTGYYYGIVLRTDNTVIKDCIAVQISDIFNDASDGTYSATRTFELQNPNEWIGTDGTQIGILGGEGFSKVPSTPVVKNLSPTVEGSILKISYEAEVR